jgi:hypothetical protein
MALHQLNDGTDEPRLALALRDFDLRIGPPGLRFGNVVLGEHEGAAEQFVT